MKEYYIVSVIVTIIAIVETIIIGYLIRMIEELKVKKE